MKTQIKPDDAAMSDVGKPCYVWAEGGEYIAILTSAGFNFGPPPTFNIIRIVKDGGYVSPRSDQPDFLYPRGSCRYTLLKDHIEELEGVLKLCKEAIQ